MIPSNGRLKIRGTVRGAGVMGVLEVMEGKGGEVAGLSRAILPFPVEKAAAHEEGNQEDGSHAGPCDDDEVHREPRAALVVILGRRRRQRLRLRRRRRICAGREHNR